MSHTQFAVFAAIKLRQWNAPQCNLQNLVNYKNEKYSVNQYVYYISALNFFFLSFCLSFIHIYDCHQANEIREQLQSLYFLIKWSRIGGYASFYIVMWLNFMKFNLIYIYITIHLLCLPYVVCQIIRLALYFCVILLPTICVLEEWARSIFFFVIYFSYNNPAVWYFPP